MGAEKIAPVANVYKSGYVYPREYGDRNGKDKKKFAGKAKGKTEFWTAEEMRKRTTEPNVIKNSDYTPAQLKRRAQARRAVQRRTRTSVQQG